MPLSRYSTPPLLQEVPLLLRGHQRPEAPLLLQLGRGLRPGVREQAQARPLPRQVLHLLQGESPSLLPPRPGRRLQEVSPAVATSEARPLQDLLRPEAPRGPQVQGRAQDLRRVRGRRPPAALRPLPHLLREEVKD